MHAAIVIIIAAVVAKLKGVIPMNMKFRKVIGDLRVNPGRIILVIFALVVGLWGVGSILVSYTILSRDLNENFVRTNPLHAAITSKDFNRLDLAALRSRPEIETAEFRDFATLRIESHPDEWIPLWLFGVEDFNNFNLAQIFDQKDNGRPTVPEDGAMLIERDGLRFSESVRGKQLKAKLVGIVITLIATLIFGWLSSRIPAQRAISASTREALSYE